MITLFTFSSQEKQKNLHLHLILQIYLKKKKLSALFKIMSQRVLCEYTANPRSIRVSRLIGCSTVAVAAVLQCSQTLGSGWQRTRRTGQMQNDVGTCCKDYGMQVQKILAPSVSVPVFFLPIPFPFKLQAKLSLWEIVQYVVMNYCQRPTDSLISHQEDVWDETTVPKAGGQEVYRYLHLHH